MNLKSFVVTFAVGAAVACNSPAPAPPAPTAAPAPQVRAMTPADNVAWYQACWQSYNKKNWEEFRKCYADNAVSMQNGYGPGAVKGGDAIVKATQDGAKSFPDAHGTPVLILGHGPHVAAVYHFAGTNSGPMPSPDGKEIPATNKPFAQLLAHMCEVDSTGKCIKDMGVQETGTLMSQLGLSKAPARPAAAAPSGAPTIVIAKGDATETKNVEVIRQSYDAFNKKDMKTMMALNASNWVMHEMANPTDQNAKQAYASLGEYWKGFPDAKINLDMVFGAGDYVFSSGTFTGTNTGPFAPMKINKTGKSVTVPMIEFDRMADGKAVETWLFYDGGSFAAQLMAPPAAKK